MLKLMQQCNQVDKQGDVPKRKASNFQALYERNSDVRDERDYDENIQGDAPSISPEDENRGILSNNPLSLLNGVFPGEMIFLKRHLVI